MSRILVTGAAGFIGSNTAQRLAKSGHRVVGIDNLNDYYDVRLKKHRLAGLKKELGFSFTKLDIENRARVRALFRKHRFDAVINLAARAGVPYSMKDPFIYVTTNTMGTLNLLDACREHGVKKMVLASTSSLYSEADMPFSESFAANTPISPYAASKKGAEAMAYSYFHLYGISTTVLRYFTVYGPAGRPDMSIFRFIEWVRQGKPLRLNGDGRQSRDFTFVDDIARGTVKALSLKGYETVNLGGNKPHSLMEVIRLIERFLGKKARICKGLPLEVDIRHTWADVGKARRLLGWRPEVPLDMGIEATVAWHLSQRRLLNRMSVFR